MRNARFLQLLVLVLIQTSWLNGSSSELESILQKKLDELQQAGAFPGATFALVTTDEKVIHLASGFANPETKEKMQPTARIFSGSVGKMFVAAVALQLVHEKKLSLEEKVSQYFEKDDWFKRLPNHANITVRMIMNHTGGLPRYILNPQFWKDLLKAPDKIWPPEELLSYIFDAEAIHPAGQGWAYSDTDYILLGMIIERITGRTYCEEQQERLLTPLGLKYTAPSDSRIIADLPSGQTGENQAPFFLPKDVLVDGVYIFNPQFEWTGGGLVTNSGDLAVWAKALYEGKVIEDYMLEEMLSSVSYQTGQPDSTGYGLAAMIRKTEYGFAYGHRGIFPGYQSIVEYYPKFRTAMAMQVNADRFSNKLKSSMTDMLDAFLPILEKQFGTVTK